VRKAFVSVPTQIVLVLAAWDGGAAMINGKVTAAVLQILDTDPFDVNVDFN
jgi:hypothetical protein